MYCFDENKEEAVNTDREFKVGDRVIGIEGGYKNTLGIKGTIMLLYPASIGIRFDKNINGHSLDELCEYGYGLWVGKKDIKLIPQTMDSLQQENKELREELNNIKDKIKSLLD